MIKDVALCSGKVGMLIWECLLSELEAALSSATATQDFTSRFAH